jgi:hypothetical protein
MLFDAADAHRRQKAWFVFGSAFCCRATQEFRY